MGLFFRNQKRQKNSSDNNITISTSTDVMFKIGEDLGVIKNTLNANKFRFEKIEKKMLSQDKRIYHLEKEVFDEIKKE